MQRIIDSYTATWNVYAHRGQLTLVVAGGRRKYDLEIASPTELSLLVDICRSGQPVTFDPETGDISIFRHAGQS